MSAKRILTVVAVCAAAVCAALPVSAQAAAKILSPVAGKWANCQSLILDVPQHCTVVYSFTGSNPLESGFAYDGPVLIDATGNITLRVVTVPDSVELSGIDGQELPQEQIVSYTVQPVPVDCPFYTEAARMPYLPVHTDAPLDIPDYMTFCIGDDEVPYIKGCRLSIAPGNPLHRFVSVKIQDGPSVYRVVMEFERTVAGSNDPVLVPEIPFPFSCRDWDTLTFSSGDGYLVSVDSGIWESGTIVKQLDRSVPHTVSWQQVSSENGILTVSGGITTAVLPPKPQILKVSASPRENSPVNLYLSDSLYRMRLSGEADTSPLYSECCLDTVAGDEAAGDLEFDVFYHGVKQGTVSVSYKIDRKPPHPPVFAPDTDTFYARRPVTLDIKSDGIIYYAVNTPRMLENGFSELAIDPAWFSADNAGVMEYSRFAKMRLNLPGSATGAVFYTVYAYTLDFSGNMSDYAVYSVIVDRHNYFVNPEAADPLSVTYAGDGSPARPFRSISEVLPLLSGDEFIRIHLSGDFFDLPSLHIGSDCEISGNKKARLEFADGAGITVENAALSLVGCVIEGGTIPAETDGSGAAGNVTRESLFQNNVISVKNGRLSVHECELVTILGNTGTVIQSENSDVSVSNTGITSQASKYAAGITAFNSDVLLNGNRITVVAPTAVVFSGSAGTLSMTDSRCMIVAQLGRIAELTRSEYRLNGNQFVWQSSFEPAAADVSSAVTTGLEAVWFDDKSKCLENTGNTSTGFSTKEK